MSEKFERILANNCFFSFVHVNYVFTNEKCKEINENSFHLAQQELCPAALLFLQALVYICM